MWNIRTPHITTQTRGLTLVEMLMATALTLIMFAAVAQIFGMMGTAMRDARATIELSGNLRSVSTNLQSDLDNVTVDVLPWVRPGANQGYFEIIEGPDRDIDFAVSDVDLTTPGIQGSLAGDADDIICFTAYSRDQPFVGLIRGELVPMALSTHPHKYYVDITSNPGTFTTITSHYAEIVYFTKHTPIEDIDGDQRRDADETVTLYRRVLLIRPDIFVGDPSTMAATGSHPMTYAEAMNYYDLSMCSNNLVSWTTNSLEDLQARERRVAHAPYFADGVKVGINGSGMDLNLAVANPLGFDPAPMRPHALMSFEQLNETIGYAGTNLRDRTGEDVVLTNTLAFDVKVYDPTASVGLDANTTSDQTLAIAPGDPGYTTSAYFLDTSSPANSIDMEGAFVDLNWSRITPSGTTEYHNQTFQNAPNSKSQLRQITPYFIDSIRNATDIYGATAPANVNDLNTNFFLQNPSMLAPSPSTVVPAYAYYDTWPFLYEVDGYDQDGDGSTDEGTNGFDDDGDDIVDDHVAVNFNPPPNPPPAGIPMGMDRDTNDPGEPSELETEPPYMQALRAVSITVRAIEPGTRQVRQDTIISDFLPD